MVRGTKKYTTGGSSPRKPLRFAGGGPVQDKGDSEPDGVGDFMAEVFRPLYKKGMRVPEGARMSENIEDRRGDAAVYNNKLAMQKTRGARSQYVQDEFFTPKKPVTQMDKDIDETIKTSRMNADRLDPRMTPSEERQTLDTGSSPGFEAKRKQQDLDELLERITRQYKAPPGKDVRSYEDLIEKESGSFAKGGLVRKSKSRGDGCCMKGHTKGRMY